MKVCSVELKNFRCFDSYKTNFNNSTIVIEGSNGSGKSSILEALHYACYLRSFRTHIPQELIKNNCDHFSIKLDVISNTDNISHTINIGFANKKKIVKIDGTPITSYEQLTQYYRTITLTEEDIFIIQAGPEYRRSFIDQVIMLCDSNHLSYIKKLKHIALQRSAACASAQTSFDTHELWAEQLWNISDLVSKSRNNALHKLQAITNELLDQFNIALTIKYQYEPRKPLYDNFSTFWSHYQTYLHVEQRVGRTLFGAHLDDFSIELSNHSSRIYASRGQQKLICVLLKVAQIILLEQIGKKSIFLLDDFLTDFDLMRITQLVNIIKDKTYQQIFTCPLTKSPLHSSLKDSDFTLIELNH